MSEDYRNRIWLVFMDLRTDYLKNYLEEMTQIYACKDACKAPRAIGCSQSEEYVYRAHAHGYREIS